MKVIVLHKLIILYKLKKNWVVLTITIKSRILWPIKFFSFGTRRRNLVALLPKTEKTVYFSGFHTYNGQEKFVFGLQNSRFISPARIAFKIEFNERRVRLHGREEVTIDIWYRKKKTRTGGNSFPVPQVTGEWYTWILL